MDQADDQSESTAVVAAPVSSHTGLSCGNLHDNASLDGWTIDVEDSGSDGEIYSQGFGDSMSAIVMDLGCTMRVYAQEWENGQVNTRNNIGGTDALTCHLSISANMANEADSYHSSCTSRKRQSTFTTDWNCRELSYTNGSYTCDCQAGYILNEAGITCIDEHECDNGNDLYDAYRCINTERSFICDCTDSERCPGNKNPEAVSCVDDAVCDSSFPQSTQIQCYQKMIIGFDFNSIDD